MKHTLLLLLLFTLSPSMLFSNSVREFRYTNFTKISIGCGMNVKITRGDYQVIVYGDEEDLKNVLGKKELNKLTLEYDRAFKQQSEITVVLSMPTLRELKLSGGSTANLSMYAAGNIQLIVESGARLTGELNCKNLDIDVDGGGIVKLNGYGSNLTTDINGGAKLILNRFAVKNVNANLSNGSELNVFMRGLLNATMSGGSRLTHYGRAKMNNIYTSSGAMLIKGE